VDEERIWLFPPQRGKSFLIDLNAVFHEGRVPSTAKGFAVHKKTP
jgi:hypothetical protein